MSAAAVRIGRQDFPRTFRRSRRSSFPAAPLHSRFGSPPEETEGEGRRGHRNSEGMTHLTLIVFITAWARPWIESWGWMARVCLWRMAFVRDQLQRTSSDSSETYTTEFFYIHLRRTGSILHQREPIFGCVISMDIILQVDFLLLDDIFSRKIGLP